MNNNNKVLVFFIIIICIFYVRLFLTLYIYVSVHAQHIMECVGVAGGRLGECNVLYGYYERL